MSLVLGLDVSSAVIGWCLLKQDLNNQISMISYGNIKPPSKKKAKGSLGLRLETTLNKIKELIKKLNPDVVVIEDYAKKFSIGKSKASVIIILAVFNETVSLGSYQILGKDPDKIPVMTIRARVSKHYGEKIKTKDDVFPFVCKKFPNFLPTKNKNGNTKKEHYDEADAAFVALGYILK